MRLQPKVYVEPFGLKPGIVGVIAALLIGGPVAAQSPKIGDSPEAANMRLVGFNDLQGRSAYQPTIHHQGDRWIAYIGHHGGTDGIPKPVNPLSGQPEFNGTSIVDGPSEIFASSSGARGNLRGWRRADDACV